MDLSIYPIISIQSLHSSMCQFTNLSNALWMTEHAHILERGLQKSEHQDSPIFYRITCIACNLSSAWYSPKKLNSITTHPALVLVLTKATTILTLWLSNKTVCWRCTSFLFCDFWAMIQFEKKRSHSTIILYPNLLDLAQTSSLAWSKFRPTPRRVASRTFEALSPQCLLWPCNKARFRCGAKS